MFFNDKKLWILSKTLLVITMQPKTKLHQFNITHEINASPTLASLCKDSDHN